MKKETLLRKNLILIICFLTVSLHARQQPETLSLIKDMISKYERYMASAIEMWRLPGAAVAIAGKDSVLYMHCFGVREAGKPEPIDARTVFRIASVSKGFTSVLTGLIVRERFLDWDDRVIQYLPSFTLKDSAYTRQLTVRHLLSHTTGIIPHAYTNLLEGDVPYDQILNAFERVQSISPPGKTYSYQNVLFSLIGDVISEVSGSGFAEQITGRLFNPLRMKDASMGLDSFLAAENRCSPHVRDGSGWSAVPVKENYYRVLPAAGVNASLSDMVIWLRAMMGGYPSVLPYSIIKKVTAPCIDTPQEFRRGGWRPRLETAHYGLGWRIYRYGGYDIITHGGWVEGFRAELGFVPELDVGIVVLLNSQGMISNYFLPDFFNMLFGLGDGN